jgi:broad specificity phosphatase PhoE
MLKIFSIFCVLFLASCKTTTFYVVRHAEKEVNTMTSDVALSEEGKQRAEALRLLLGGKDFSGIYSTNYLRTRSTAQPLAQATGSTVRLYEPSDTAFVNRLRQTATGNLLLVGHSNTVDDLVNRLVGDRVIPGDLPDTQYGDLFIVKKKGKSFRLTRGHFGK